MSIVHTKLISHTYALLFLLMWYSLEARIVSSVEWLGYGLDNQGIIVQLLVVTETFLFFKVSRLALEPNQSPLQWVLGALSSKVKQSLCEADHWPPSSVEIIRNNAATPPLWSYGFAICTGYLTLLPSQSPLINTCGMSLNSYTLHCSELHTNTQCLNS